MSDPGSRLMNEFRGEWLIKQTTDNLDLMCSNIPRGALWVQLKPLSLYIKHLEGHIEYLQARLLGWDELNNTNTTTD